MNNLGKIKLRKRIGTKLLAIVILSFVISITVAAGSLWYGSKKMIDQVLEDTTRVAMVAILDRTETMKDSSTELAQELASDDNVVSAVEAGEPDGIIKAVNTCFNDFRGDTEFVTITDAQGNVLARTHSDKKGDSILNQKNIAEALKGNSAAYIEKGTEVKLSVRSSAPIMNTQGKVIGAISTGYKLDNPNFVDEMKKLTGTDVTVFLADERINTTIERDGKRQIGTKLNPAIADIVLNQKKSYYAIANILDKPYYTAYEPIVAGGEVMGIFFAGMPIESIKKLEASLALGAVSLVLVIGVLTIIIIRTLMNKLIIKPVMMVSEAAVRLAEGDLDIGKMTHRYDDEIGRMMTGIRDMAGVMKSLITNMDQMAKSHDMGDTEAKTDETAYRGAYREVAHGINAMVGSYIKHMLDICNVLKEFGNGDFNAEYELLPGKKALANQMVEELRTNLKEISKRIDFLVGSALEGRLNARADTNGTNGDWKKLLEYLNTLMDAIIAPINEASDVLCAMSNGNLKAKVTGVYKGDFDIIKTSLNSTQQNISSYISEISEVLSEMSNHNLNVRIDRQYIGDFGIIKDSINMIIAKFNNILSDFNASAEQVAYGSRQISESSMNLSQGASEQASAVEELNAVIEQVSAQTDKNAETANKAGSVARGTKDLTQKEAVMMQDMLAAMEAINESSNNISKIIKVIDDIAFQTNLLALNAAVEAARAGEQGKGFSVVAEEVRNLASKSKSAAGDTTTLIESSIQKVSEGVRVANETSKGLITIVEQITEISSFIDTIAVASTEQNANINQIHEGIVQVSQVTQTNTSISQESAASAEELSSRAEVFRNTIAQFKLKK